MKRITTKHILASFVVLVGLGAGIWYSIDHNATSIATHSGALAPSATADTELPTASGAIDSPGASPSANSASATDDRPYSVKFADAQSYSEFVASALPAAISGDRDAQYYISAAMTYCEEANRFYFIRKGRFQTVDEAVAEMSSKRQLSYIEGIHRAHRRCSKMTAGTTSSWGRADEWLAKATDAGQPLAQTTTAMNVFMQTTMTGKSVISRAGARRRYIQLI
jgi:hypothetical protein